MMLSAPAALLGITATRGRARDNCTRRLPESKYLLIQSVVPYDGAEAESGGRTGFRFAIGGPDTGSQFDARPYSRVGTNGVAPFWHRNPNMQQTIATISRIFAFITVAPWESVDAKLRNPTSFRNYDRRLTPAKSDA